MRIQSLGHKLRTGVLSMALLSSPTPMAKAAETLGGETNLLAKTFSDNRFSKSNLTDKSTVYWDDLMAQQGPAIKASVKKNVPSGRISDILDPQKRTPRFVRLIGETAESKIYKIPTDSAAAINKLFNGVQDKFTNISIAVPKNKADVSFRDCAIRATAKPIFSNVEGSHTDTLNRTIFMKGGNTTYVDSASGVYPAGTGRYNGYYSPKRTNEGQVYNWGTEEISIGSSANPEKTYNKMDKHGRQATEEGEFYARKNSILSQYNELLPPKVLRPGNMAETLSDTTNLPKGVKYISEIAGYRKFELNSRALKTYNDKIDTIDINKAFLFQEKENSGWPTNYHHVAVDYKPVIYPPENGLKNTIGYTKKYFGDDAPTLTIETIFSETENTRVNAVCMTHFHGEEDRKFTIIKAMHTPKADAPSHVQATTTYSLYDIKKDTSFEIPKKDYDAMEKLYTTRYRNVLEK